MCLLRCHTLVAAIEEICEFVEDEKAGHGNIEAQPGPDHGNLDATVEKIDHLGRIEG